MTKRIFLLLQLCILSAVLLLSGCATAPRPSTMTLTSANKIALLVPLSGPLSPYGTAIRNGFFTAYYDQKNRSTTSPTITVFDTNGKPIQTVYQTAVAQGADFVVGPLDKNEVTTLSQLSTLPASVLALNTGNTPSNNASLIEFALSPSDEAQQAAIKAAADGRHNVIILAPSGAYGTRLVAAFSDQWKKSGGNIVATQYYNDISTLSQSIGDLLQITKGRSDAKVIEKILHRDVRYLPQRRQDFDSVFIVATPAMAKQIQLLLRFYFVDNVPVYATSQAYNGTPDPDLNGLLFCEMPWVLAPNRLPADLLATQQHIQATWPDNYSNLAKFYAMGVDAFNMIPQLPAMASNANQGFSAATGTLFLSTNHQITRQLLWAQIQNGVPVVQ